MWGSEASGTCTRFIGERESNLLYPVIQYTLELMLLLDLARGFELRLDSEVVICCLSFF